MAGILNDSYAHVVFFFSGVVWLPYVCLLLLLYREHEQRRKFPQNVILLLLSLDALLRCVWFFLYQRGFAEQLFMVLLNRIAILTQFSALSILMLMWMRALRITSLADRMSRKAMAAVPGGPGGPMAVGRTSSRSREMSSERWRSVKHSHNEALLRLEAEKQQMVYIRLTVAVNIIVWVAVLASLAKSGNAWYDINILTISVLCLVEALITLIIGMRTALALQRELSPTTITNSDLNQGQHRVETGVKAWIRCMCSSCSPFYRLFFSKDDNQYGLQIQRDVVKTIVGVSVIVFVFFLLRSFCFLNRPVLEVDLNDASLSDRIGSATYPFFFYQFPEFFPNLAIALGIAPPKSIIRSLYRFCTFKDNVHGKPHLCLTCFGREVLVDVEAGPKSSEATSERRTSSRERRSGDPVVPRRGTNSDNFFERKTRTSSTNSKSRFQDNSNFKNEPVNLNATNPLHPIDEGEETFTRTKPVPVSPPPRNVTKSPDLEELVMAETYPSMQSLASSEPDSISRASEINRQSTTKIASFSISKPIVIPNRPSDKSGRSFSFGRKSKKDWAAEEDGTIEYTDPSPSTQMTGSSMFGSSDRPIRDGESESDAGDRMYSSEHMMYEEPLTPEQVEEYEELLYNIQSLSSHNTNTGQSVDTSSVKLRDMLEQASGQPGTSKSPTSRFWK